MTTGDSATKQCSRCGEAKPATTEFFSPRSDGRLKLHSWCKTCFAQATRDARKASPENRAKHIAAVAAYQKRRAETDAEYRGRLKESALARNRRRRADPVKREIELAQERAWRKANWDRVKKYKHKSGALQVHHVAMRNAAKLQATPAWADHDKIAAMYDEARRLTRETGVEHNVDHVVPLRGRLVCGLHVENNLRVITAQVNKLKANKLIEALAVA